jgi:hypothetical protein
MMIIETEKPTLAKVDLMAKESVPPLWSAMLPILDEKAKDFLTVFSEEELFNLLCHGIMDLWIGVKNGQLDGFALCAWEVHARARYYHVLGIFGDNLRFYLDEGLVKMEKYAMTMGAFEVVVEGRKGWQRLLKSRGYGPRTVRLRKNVRRAWSN